MFFHSAYIVTSSHLVCFVDQMNLNKSETNIRQGWSELSFLDNCCSNLPSWTARDRSEFTSSMFSRLIVACTQTIETQIPVCLTVNEWKVAHKCGEMRTQYTWPESFNCYNVERELSEHHYTSPILDPSFISITPLEPIVHFLICFSYQPCFYVYFSGYLQNIICKSDQKTLSSPVKEAKQ